MDLPESGDAAAMAAPGYAIRTNLFILSGQSNMALLDHHAFFDPVIAELLPGDTNISVKDAEVGQPIRRWYKLWRPAVGDTPIADGLLYDRLMVAVRRAIEGRHVDTITLVWMQGERDALEMHGTVYAASLVGLVEQLRVDLGRPDVNFIIGRLSDWSIGNTEYGHWDEVRAAQEHVAGADHRASWVDTDDLDRKDDGIHFSWWGFQALGRRFANSAVDLIDP